MLVIARPTAIRALQTPPRLHPAHARRMQTREKIYIMAGLGNSAAAFIGTLVVVSTQLCQAH